MGATITKILAVLAMFFAPLIAQDVAPKNAQKAAESAESAIDSANKIAQDSAESTKSTMDSKTTASKNPKPYEPTAPYAYVTLSTSVIALGCIGGAGVLYLLPESTTNWDKSEVRNVTKNWTRKVKDAPFVDADDFFLNWVTHPYWGAVYYMQPRVAGFSPVESAFYAFVASTIVWEYGIEAFAERPSWQDLVITPAFGSLLGEGFYRATRHIQSNGDELLGSVILGKTALFLMDPIGFVIQRSGLAEAFGIDNKHAQSAAVPLVRGGELAGLNVQFSYRF